MSSYFQKGKSPSLSSLTASYQPVVSGKQLRSTCEDRHKTVSLFSAVAREVQEGGSGSKEAVPNEMLGFQILPVKPAPSLSAATGHGSSQSASFPAQQYRKGAGQTRGFSSCSWDKVTQSKQLKGRRVDFLAYGSRGLQYTTPRQTWQQAGNRHGKPQWLRQGGWLAGHIASTLKK